MRYILRFFGLIRVRDLVQYLDTEHEYWDAKKKSMTDVDDVLHENYTNQHSHYMQMIQMIKQDILMRIGI